MQLNLPSIVLIVGGIILVIVSGIFLRRLRVTGQQAGGGAKAQGEDVASGIEFWTWVGRIGTGSSIIGCLLAVMG